jgi:hypothetical protein
MPLPNQFNVEDKIIKKIATREISDPSLIKKLHPNQFNVEE